ncbi:MAG: hypothetical protein KatS3mg102_2847 [Planctomycetota bacterium]|nr:MAG: hypothetical protein KatS3mg102_2847 [Planctomycetota bacterium]
MELVDRGLEQAAESGRELLARGREAAEGVVAAGRELVDRVADTFDPGTHIRQLDSEGDSVKIKLGGFAQVEVRGEAAAELEVRRTAEGYEVEVSGEAGVGLIGQLGGEAGAEAQASARAMLMAGGKVTMSFRTAEEAERAVGALARMGAVAAASQAAPGPLGWVAGAGAQALIGPSEEDMQFLSQHTRSVELRGGAAGVVAGELGIAETLDVGGEAGLRQDMGLVIHFPERNAAGQVTRGPQVTVFHETTFAAKGEAAAVGAVRGAMEGKVRLEQTVQLPASVNMERFLQDPGAVAREVRDRATVQPARMKVEGWVRGGGGVSGLYAHAGAQAGAGFEYTIEGVNPQRALLATNYITAGDMQRGLEVIDPDATYSGQIYGYGYAGVEFAPEVSVLGVGVGIEAAYQHQDRGTPIRFQGRARELRFEDLQRRLEQAAQQPPPAVRQHR